MFLGTSTPYQMVLSSQLTLKQYTYTCLCRQKGWQDLLCHTVLHDACVPVHMYIYMHFSLILHTYV